MITALLFLPCCLTTTRPGPDSIWVSVLPSPGLVWMTVTELRELLDSLTTLISFAKVCCFMLIRITISSVARSFTSAGPFFDARSRMTERREGGQRLDVLAKARVALGAILTDRRIIAQRAACFADRHLLDANKVDDTVLL